MELDSLAMQTLENLVTQLRRDFHQYPELSGHEQRTQSVIVNFLHRLGIKTQTYKTHYGVGGIITGAQPGPIIALRADMDALPIQEECDVPYKSVNKGIMHACGHDGHMAMLLGAASLLVQYKDKLAGTVKLVFQPAEEASPTGGAKSMLQEGFLKDVDVIFGLHLWPDLPTGHIGIKPGPMMAASDRFTVKIVGKDAHAGQPHKGIDAITIGASVINNFSYIISRQTNPIETATLSIGTIKGGERYNVIAKEVVMEGTIRTLNEGIRSQIPCQIRNITAGIAGSYGANYELDYQPGYPVLNNWQAPTQRVMQAACATVGEKSVHADIKPALGAEDFANYLTDIPGAFFWLGCSNPEKEAAILHNSHFSIEEKALTVGANVFFQIVADSLMMSFSGGDEQRTRGSALIF